MANVIVYSKPNCMQCNFTKKFLEDQGVAHDVIDVTEDAQALETVKALGFQALPVIVAPNVEPFYGFRPDLLEKLV